MRDVSARAAAAVRIPVPLPFAMDPLNAWLVDQGDGLMLIDTGMATGASWRALERGVEDAGFRWGDIGCVVLTHMHPDHVGLAPQVVEASGAAAHMHALDVDLLGIFSEPGNADHWNGVALGLAGTPAELVEPVNAAFHMLTVKFPRADGLQRFEGGQRFGRFEAIWTPGHSPGHVCLYDRERRILFSGDHLLETISPNIGWLPDGDPLGDYLTSLEGLAELEIDQVLPGHGEPIRDHRAWIARAKRHHETRLGRIVELLRAAPRSAHAVSRELWQRELDPIAYRFAIFEVLAHLVHLESTGRVRRFESVWSAR